MVASGRKLNVRRDLRWVAKRTGKFPHKYMRVAKENHFKADISCISLANNRLMDVTQLASSWVGWPNGKKLALTCVQIWSRPKWAQVIASQRKCTQASAKRSRKLTQVFYLRLPASQFRQGLKLTEASSTLEKFKNTVNTGQFGFVFEENSVKVITWLSWRHRFRKALLQNLSSAHWNA